jgi:hypothetical protein
MILVVGINMTTTLKSVFYHLADGHHGIEL